MKLLLSIVLVLTLLALIAPSCEQGGIGGYGGGYGGGANGADGNSQGYGYTGIDPRGRPYGGGYPMNGGMDGRGTPYSYNGVGRSDGSAGYGYNRNYYYSSGNNVFLSQHLTWFLLPVYFLVREYFS